MKKMENYIEIMDTTLRDGEQTSGVTFTPQEKLSIAKALLEDVNVDRIEVGSARVSAGEAEAVREIAEWAGENKCLGRVEVLGFVDCRASVEWAKEVGVKRINLLAKGSLKHLSTQLKKTPAQHLSGITEVLDNAAGENIALNVYLEDWSNGMLESREYTLWMVEELGRSRVERIMLPDTLGVLDFVQTGQLIRECTRTAPKAVLEFHAHNDYGLATANTIAAINAGAKGVHTTVNGLGERAGNAPLEEVAVAIKDHTSYNTGINETKLSKLSRLVEAFSGRKVACNKPVVGDNAFTQCCGVHADGDLKGNLYYNRLTPERFGRERVYALGKLSGKASLEQNLKRIGIELTGEEKKKVLDRIITLGDRKEAVTTEDLPYIVSDVLQTPKEQKVRITECNVRSGYGKVPHASLKLSFNGLELAESATGNGGYDAFMNALKKAAEKTDLKIPRLADYEVRIPPGGRTDAIVETTIKWEVEGREIKTIGVDSDQVMAAVKATEKMLNIIYKK